MQTTKTRNLKLLVSLDENVVLPTDQLAQKYKITRSTLIGQCLKFFAVLSREEQIQILTDEAPGMK